MNEELSPDQIALLVREASLLPIYRQEIGLSHEYLDNIAYRLHLPPTSLDSTVPARLDTLDSVIAGGVLLTRAQVVGIVVGSLAGGVLVGLAIGSYLARRRAEQDAASQAAAWHAWQQQAAAWQRG